MKIGKLSNDILQELIIDSLSITREEVIVRPAIGEDCAAFDLDKNVCVMSSDPITGATKNLGSIAVNVATNDIAATGAEPFGIMITLLIPPDATIKQLKEIMADINKTTKKLNIDVLGGHTEVTDAVTRFVIVSTAVGKIKKSELIQTKNAHVGDALLVTKSIGLEGTTIIINEKINELSDLLTIDEINEANSFGSLLSVLPEGMIAREFKVHAMHDVTEGGIYGAIWEMCTSSKTGAIINKNSIPIKNLTKKLCKFYNINPYKLISSGSMLIACDPSTVDDLCKALNKKDIKCSKLGILTKNPSILLEEGENTSLIEQPTSDELYKVI